MYISFHLGEDASEDAVQKFVCTDKKEEFELKLDDRLNDDLSKLVRRCRSFDPKDRPKISGTLKQNNKTVRIGDEKWVPSGGLNI